jgi:GNAT superfamily N-acetyltransferase
MPVTIRDATADDIEVLHELIVALAVYEREPDAVTGTPAMLGEALFGPSPVAEALIAEASGAVAGFALHHPTFSTWECTPGIWLEDLFVRPEHRRAGVGETLVRHLAGLALARGCGRLEWAALTWNTPALDFYAKLGADRLEEWAIHRLEGATLAGVAGGGADRRA